MVTNVTSLLKTVKTVEDEASRGTQALEGTIEAINQEIKVSSLPFLKKGANNSKLDKLIPLSKWISI